MASARHIEETEISPTTPLSLLRGNKPVLAMNPAAHGWSRQPLIDTRLYNGLGGWGRNKRWEYWGIMTPTHIIGITISSLGYAGVNQLYVVDRATLSGPSIEAVTPLARGVELAETYGQPARFVSKNLSISITESWENGEHLTHLRATGRLAGTRKSVSAGAGAGAGAAAGAGTEVDVQVAVRRAAQDDALHVVVPWSTRRFQYTIKEPALPVQGTITFNGMTHEFGGANDHQSFGVLDHGRGRWPYSMVWNWAAGSGYVDGKRVGLQLGDKWTTGTGSTENALIVDGHLTKISEELVWEYDRSDWLKPWRVTGTCIEATFTPFYERVATTSLVVLSGETHQCFGTWSGTFTHADGTVQSLDGLEGWAEEARNRW